MQCDISINTRKTLFQKTLSRILSYTILIFLAVFTLLPFLWMVSSSLKPERELFRIPIEWIPVVPFWENYARVFTEIPYTTYYLNSLIISVAVTVLQVLTSAMMGFSLAKLHYPGRSFILLLYLSTMMVPFQVIMVPQFLLIKRMGLFNTHLAIIVLQAFTPFGVFLVRQFFMGLPNELLEAAEIDGTGYIKLFVYIVLPLGKPALSSLVIRTFIFAMNDFLTPFLYLNDISLKTITVGLRSLTTDYSSNYALQMAGSTMALLPILLVYALGQNQIVNGISLGGGGSIKG